MMNFLPKSLHKSMRKPVLALSAAAAVVVVAGCATKLSPEQQLDLQLAEMMKTNFRDEGIAKVDRLVQDESNAVCSKALGADLPKAAAEAIEAANLKTIRKPSDGKYLGDWKAGEKLAQSGKGMTWSDKSTATKDNGGNCYNCHQLTKAEISFGTIGPSLYNYGKLRGVTDPNSADARAMVEYTWSKIWNARAYNACSNMPRFGHNGIMDEAQIKDLMALLLDPKSPVNQ